MDDALQGAAAANHLAVVAAGADSIVVGEIDVLAQVRAAFASTGGVLRRFGDIAIAAAREARATVSANTRDAGRQLDLALDVAGGHVPESLCVLGTGAMARNLAKRAQALGIKRIVVSGRHRKRADALAAELGVQSAEIATLPAETAFACVVLAFKGTPSDSFARAVIDAASRAKLIIDLTMPRFWPELCVAPVVDLGTLARRSKEPDEDRVLRARLRAAALAAVDRRRAHTADVGSGLAAMMYRYVEEIRRQEVLRARVRCEADCDATDRVTKALVKKLFHAYGAALREGHDASVVASARRFFVDQGARASEQDSDTSHQVEVMYSDNGATLDRMTSTAEVLKATSKGRQSHGAGTQASAAVE